MESKKDLNNLRDCVKKAFDEGVGRGWEFNKMRHAIIVELKRLGYPSPEIEEMLLEWNKRCEKVLSYVEQKRQLLDYVKWVDKQESRGKSLRVGCKALEDYCIGEDKCVFNNRRLYSNRKVTDKSPFDFNEARKFLDSRYKGPEGFMMYLILSNLRRHQIEKGTGTIIFIGHKGLATLIKENDGYTIQPMTLNRRIKDLVNEGFIEITVQGKKGTFSVVANGYRFLPWQSPPSDSN